MRNRAICANVEVTKSAIYITSQDRKPAVTATAATVRGAVCFLVLLLFGFSSAFVQQHSGNLYWAPPNYTVGGEQIDSILNFIFWLTLFVFIAGRPFWSSLLSSIVAGRARLRIIPTATTSLKSVGRPFPSSSFWASPSTATGCGQNSIAILRWMRCRSMFWPSG